MSRETVEQLMDTWVNDPTFRTELRTDPVAAVRARGMELTDDELAALQSVDWNQSDEELTARVNKC